MNTVGKTLVILNFLFAVIVGAFLVVDFVARANWKTAYDELKKEAIVSGSSRDLHAEDSGSMRAQVKTLMLDIEKQRNDLLDQEARAKVEIAQLELKVNEEQTKAKDADTNLAKAVADIERLKVSEADLKRIIKERETAILSLQDDIKKHRNEAIASDNQAKQVTDRNQELLAEVQKLTGMIERLRNTAAVGGDGGPSITPRVGIGNEPNPPNVMVKGKVDRVDKDLVQISLGTDHGVNTGNTMEVFRYSPAPKYLGMLKIVEASPRTSIGRMVVPPGASRPQLVEGDQVWSRLK